MLRSVMSFPDSRGRDAAKKWYTITRGGCGCVVGESMVIKQMPLNGTALTAPRTLWVYVRLLMGLGDEAPWGLTRDT